MPNPYIDDKAECSDSSDCSDCVDQDQDCCDPFIKGDSELSSESQSSSESDMGSAECE
jgi:hypothetical protein